jgi:mono/diheme cytochrome c family protein
VLLRLALPCCLLAACVAGYQAGVLPQSGPTPKAAERVQYAREIQPILAANCFTCHGPDDKARKAGLRLDIAKDATKELANGDRAIVPGRTDDSELVARIFSNGGDRMPPAKSNHTLKDHEKQLLKRWIAEGAEYQKHWAFLAPQRPALLVTKDKNWARNEVDRFILSRLEREGLAPSPEADRYTLARRLAIDLTGLPPSLEEADRFINNPSPNAYEEYVDALLHSPAYGERWAHVWLDLARYADSNGYAEDRPRVIWKYRDWVIDAINRNLPFDRFTIEQLAGDLLPQPTTAQLLATAFHRNTLTNTEGGTDDEEFRVAAVVDRVNTTFQVWMGITINCAQCHDHKFDPVTQEEYFRVYAIFNQTEDSDKPDNRPTLPTPTPEQLQRKARVQRDIAVVETTLNTVQFAAALEMWEETAAKSAKVPAKIGKILAVPQASRTAQQLMELKRYFSTIPPYKQLGDQVAALQKQLNGVEILSTPIMRELPEAKMRKTFVHVRGNFLVNGKEVGPAVPAAFHTLQAEQPANRLTLARWLVDPANTLTARVAVNRYWEQIFGTGLVETPEDFGIRGKLPKHPELLDGLAVEFQRDWDVRRLLKLLVMSAAYRQESRVTPALEERDPNNLLFARGPRFRSSAETIRDQALFVSGLLDPKVGGPSVRPPRPKTGLVAAFGGSTDWTTSAGSDRHRRALYTEWRRSTPYPSMVTFDAPDRNVCVVNRPRTNTPLQALVTLNDPVYVEAAQALARRIVKEGGATVEARAAHGFRLCLTRPPQPAELERLVSLCQQARQRFAADPKAAAAMATEPIGPLPPEMDVVDLAAWTVVGNVLLNLDEMMARR